MKEKPRICGFVRPISSMDGHYTADHWLAVHGLVERAASKAGFDLRLVSDSNSSGVIVSDIIKNLYRDEIVVCDVSAYNSNVMFELGMRVAFEKPIVIIKDRNTKFSFDISAIRHVEYDRMLRYDQAENFQSELESSINATLAEFAEPDHRGYLQQFGPVEVTKISNQRVSLEQIAEDVKELKRSASNAPSASALSHFGRPADQAAQDAVALSALRGGIRERFGIRTTKPFADAIMQKLSGLGGVHGAQSITMGAEAVMVRIDLPAAARIVQEQIARSALAVAREVDPLAAPGYFV